MLKADLEVAVFTKEGLLIERRRQRSHSFVAGLMQLLYTGHANLGWGEPYNAAKDILGSTRSIDIDEMGVPLVVASGPGAYDQIIYSDHDEIRHVAADLIGIQIGEGTTVETPDDYQMEDRIKHSEHITETTDELEAWYTVAVTPWDLVPSLYGVNWWSTDFRVSRDRFNIRYPKIKAYRVGSPGTVTVGIRTTKNGADLCTSTINGNTFTLSTAGAWYQLGTFSPSNVELDAGSQYHYVIRATGGDSSNYVVLTGDTDENSQWGSAYWSSTSGVSWNYYNTVMFLFEIWGRVLYEGIMYGGTEVHGMSISHPNGSFDIRRYFTNLSGGSQTINEIGVYSPSKKYGVAPYVFCIARDKLGSPISLAQNNILRVTYTPSIVT